MQSLPIESHYFIWMETLFHLEKTLLKKTKRQENAQEGSIVVVTVVKQTHLTDYKRCRWKLLTEHED